MQRRVGGRRHPTTAAAALTLAGLDGGLHIGHGGRGAELQHMGAVCRGGRAAGGAVSVRMALGTGMAVAAGCMRPAMACTAPRSEPPPCGEA